MIARLSSEMRKQQILRISSDLCKKINYKRLTKKTIAQRAKISKSLINYHFDSMEELRESLLQYACDHRIMHIILQGLIENEPIFLKLPSTIKRKAIKCTLN